MLSDTGLAARRSNAGRIPAHRPDGRPGESPLPKRDPGGLHQQFASGFRDRPAPRPGGERGAQAPVSHARTHHHREFCADGALPSGIASGSGRGALHLPMGARLPPGLPRDRPGEGFLPRSYDRPHGYRYPRNGGRYLPKPAFCRGFPGGARVVPPGKHFLPSSGKRIGRHRTAGTAVGRPARMRHRVLRYACRGARACPLRSARGLCASGSREKNA